MDGRFWIIPILAIASTLLIISFDLSACCNLKSYYYKQKRIVILPISVFYSYKIFYSNS